MGNDKLKVIAHELLTALKSHITVDRSHRESAGARMRAPVERILRKYGYPPDLLDCAVQTVLRQAEAVVLKSAKIWSTKGIPTPNRVDQRTWSWDCGCVVKNRYRSFRPFPKPKTTQ